MSDMRLNLMRWLLSPIISWHAYRLSAASRGQLDFDTAWRRARIASHPDELPYQQHGHRAPSGRGVALAGSSRRNALPTERHTQQNRSDEDGAGRAPFETDPKNP